MIETNGSHELQFLIVMDEAAADDQVEKRALFQWAGARLRFSDTRPVAATDR
jgi:hypothetical protein